MNALKKLFILFSLTVVASACGSQNNLNAQSSSQLSGQITSMTYMMSGSGDIQFEAIPGQQGAYQVHVSRYNFQSVNRTINLTNAQQGFQVIDQIFRRSVVVSVGQQYGNQYGTQQYYGYNNGYPQQQYGGYNGYSMGSSQMTLSSGSNSIMIQSPTINGDPSQLQMLYQAIASQI